MKLYSSLLAFALLSACATQPKPAPIPVQIVGGDRDVHGCIPSAGYTWCERESACVRPWELAAAKKFANDAEAFKQYCSSKPK